MAEYHVGSGLFGIYCGTLNKPTKDGYITWKNKTDCTDEDSKKLSRHSYEWTTTDGKTVRLILEIEEGLKDGKGD